MNWHKIRLKVLERDNYTCKLKSDDCSKRLTVHHIIPDGSNTLDNLETVCNRHHRAIHKRLTHEKLKTRDIDRTRVALNSKLRSSLRTTIPMSLVEQADLKNHDKLIWTRTIKNNRIVVEVSKE